MPYVTDDNSKAMRRITEIEQRLQETKAELYRWLAAGYTPTSAAELVRREREGKALTDRLQALATALELQRALAGPALHGQERTLAKASLKKMKDFGYRPVTVQFLGGLEVELMARYWCRSQARAEKGKGSYFGLTLLGVCDRTTPALASEVAQLAAALSSFEDAQARLRQMGVTMSIRRIANVAYHFAQRRGAVRKWTAWASRARWPGGAWWFPRTAAGSASARTSGARRPRRGGRVITPIGASRSCW